MTAPAGSWVLQRELWKIGNLFVESRAEDLDATVTAAIGRVGKVSNAASASVWRSVRPTHEASVVWEPR